MYVTPLLGTFRAKGDQWGTISSNTFKPEKVNLLTRTERMARAVQVYLQRQGYSNITGVEAILLCANPSIHVDSLRPIVRIVMRDALERFVISIAQARLTLSADTVYDIVNRIINPPAPKQETPAPATTTTESTIPAWVEAAAGGEASAPSFSSPGSESAFKPGVADQSLFPLGENAGQSLPPTVGQPPAMKRRGFTRKQWFFLVFMALIWIILMAVFIFFVVKDLFL
jgi:hypothetical protein